MRSANAPAAGCVIHRVVSFDLPVVAHEWPFAEQRRSEIDAHFAACQAQKPDMWNGRVLLCRNPQFCDGCFRASYFEVDFASFMAWRDWGWPDRSVYNAFGMGALRASDGAFVLGVMADHTANAGRIYFPAGTPDPDDVTDGRLDLAANVAREVAEETGLAPQDYEASPEWYCVVSGASIAAMRVLSVAQPGEALRDRINAALARQRKPELARVHLVRSRADLQPAMSEYVTAFIDFAMARDEDAAIASSLASAGRDGLP